MDFEAYAQRATELVNAPVNDLDDLKALFGARSWWADEATERDVVALRRARRRLREVFELGVNGKDAEVVEELNALLAAYPVQPRISGHDASDWHMHVTGRGASISAEYLAGAVWGLAVWLCEYGSSRFGICADERCADVYLDTSSNCCRRFCSERCATRSHVAAHRARKRAEASGGRADAAASSSASEAAPGARGGRAGQGPVGNSGQDAAGSRGQQVAADTGTTPETAADTSGGAADEALARTT